MSTTAAANLEVVENLETEETVEETAPAKSTLKEILPIALVLVGVIVGLVVLFSGVAEYQAAGDIIVEDSLAKLEAFYEKYPASKP